MAKTKSLLTAGLRGTVGGTLVFRRLNGETVVAAAPVPTSKQPSESQMMQRERFRLASLYAKRAFNDPELRVEYELVAKVKKLPSARAAAIADYFRFPEILNAKISTDQSGVVIVEAVVVDYLRVKSVTISVISPDGSVLETGNGVLGIDNQTWTYQVQNSANLIAEMRFDIHATDLPGNVTTQCLYYQD
jgi:hypothetical protein